MAVRSIFSLISPQNRFNSQTLARIATASSPANEFLNHLRRNPGDLEKTLSTVDAKLDAKCVTEVIERCDMREAQMGLRFFVWAGLQRGYRHTHFAYSKACKSFKIDLNPNLIKEVIESYRSEKCIVSVNSFKIVLNLCKEAKLADKALWVLRNMSEFGIRGDSTMYSVVIRLFCWKGDLEKAVSLMREMTGSGDLYPDMTTFVEMLNGFCRAERFDEAFELFQIAKKQGCSLNVVLYSGLINGLCKSGDIKSALKVLEEMESIGGEISPNAVTYTCIIQRFCEERRTSRAVGILERMISRGCSPNHVTAGCLINHFCREGLVEEIQDVIDKIVGGGSVSHEKCLSLFIVALERVGRVKEAEEWLNKLIGGEMKPDGLASFVVVNGMCLAERFLDGYRLCVDIEKVGDLRKVDSSVFSVLLAGLFRQECLNEAAELAKLLLKKGIHTKAPYVKRIIKNIEKSGVTELACNSDIAT